MKITIRSLAAMLAMAALTTLSPAQEAAPAGKLKLHAIFNNHMVIQRGKPIKIWGWAKPGGTVSVKLGDAEAKATVQQAKPLEVFGYEEEYAGLGRWEVTFPAREASAVPRTLTVNAGAEKVELTEIVFGDVWVMHGQSNMGFPLRSTDGRNLAAQGDLPMLRLFSITGNEQATPQDDIRPEGIATDGWEVSSPESASEFSAIGWVFGAHLQRSVGIPIGLIYNGRGGASIESMVPLRKFDEYPLTKRYADHVKAEMAAFDPEAEADRMWEIEKSVAKRKNQPEPKRPDPKNLRSWNVPGKSPSDMASVYNGSFGVFKGLNIKGVVFHQGYNNTVGDSCRPKRYGKLVELMVEGWREDFNDPDLAVGVIGFCADGGQLQNEENFEERSTDTGPYIREGQRLGLTEAAGTGPTVFIPAYDVQSPGLHPFKKREHGWRAARWALSEVYKVDGFSWKSTKPVSAEPKGDIMVLTFDGRVLPDDGEKIPRGFSIAGEDGKFYLAHARFQPWEKKDARTQANRTIRVWSPLVEKPVAVRYGWSNCPIGNLKCNGDQDIALPSFRTDNWDLPEEEDPALKPISREVDKQRKEDAQARLEFRRKEEAKQALEIIERLKTLGQAGEKEQGSE